MYLEKVGFFILILIYMAVGKEKILHRKKRFLYYPQGGSFKLVLGFGVPVPLGLKQSMAWGWNFQFQYQIAQYTNQTMVYPPVVSRKKRTAAISDRSLFYKGIEAVLDSNEMHGRQCLLHSICENALFPVYHEANGLYGQLLHIALTPDYGDGIPERDLDPIYMDAKKAGEYGVDCQSLYPECKHGDGIMDRISLFDY